jgi:hypothetical protein
MPKIKKSGRLGTPIAVVQLRFGQSNGTVASIGEVRPKEALRLIDRQTPAGGRDEAGGGRTRRLFSECDGHLAKTGGPGAEGDRWV